MSERSEFTQGAERGPREGEARGGDAVSERDEQSGPTRPLLRVVRGEPDAVELAALIAVVAATASAPATEAEPTPNAWNDRARLVRSPLPHGPGAWRASAWRA